MSINIIVAFSGTGHYRPKVVDSLIKNHTNIFARAFLLTPWINRPDKRGQKRYIDY